MEAHRVVDINSSFHGIFTKTKDHLPFSVTRREPDGDETPNSETWDVIVCDLVRVLSHNRRI
jgi:hypothetical protein